MLEIFTGKGLEKAMVPLPIQSKLLLQEIHSVRLRKPPYNIKKAIRKNKSSVANVEPEFL